MTLLSSPISLTSLTGASLLFPIRVWINLQTNPSEGLGTEDRNEAVRSDFSAKVETEEVRGIDTETDLKLELQLL